MEGLDSDGMILSRINAVRGKRRGEEGWSGSGGDVAAAGGVCTGR
jgi:hypothetical protein